MHVPSAYSVTDLKSLYGFIRSHSFAILTSQDGASSEAPVATHLPLLLELEGNLPDPADQLGQSVKLIGHMARGNPQWKHCDNRSVLAIFSGPHSYISAGWYGEQNVVPTWNYVAVHVTGTLHIEHSPDRTYELLKRMVSFYEQHNPAPWTMESASGDYIEKLIGGIVAFTISIERIEGCWKLSQHHPAERREKTRMALLARNHGDDAKIASLMSES